MKSSCIVADWISGTVAEAVARFCHSLCASLQDCLLVPADRALCGALDTLFGCALETRVDDVPACGSDGAEAECLKQPAINHMWLQGSFYLLTAAHEFSIPVVSHVLTVPTTVVISLQQASEGLVGRG